MLILWRFVMFVRKAALEALELWSEALEMVECLDEWIIDWRWLTIRNEEEPTFKSECVLID
jgi:hypothetical protein